MKFLENKSIDEAIEEIFSAFPKNEHRTQMKKSIETALAVFELDRSMTMYEDCDFLLDSNVSMLEKLHMPFWFMQKFQEGKIDGQILQLFSSKRQIFLPTFCEDFGAKSAFACCRPVLEALYSIVAKVHLEFKLKMCKCKAHVDKSVPEYKFNKILNYNYNDETSLTKKLKKSKKSPSTPPTLQEIQATFTECFTEPVNTVPCKFDEQYAIKEYGHDRLEAKKSEIERHQLLLMAQVPNFPEMACG